MCRDIWRGMEGGCEALVNFAWNPRRSRRAPQKPSTDPGGELARSINRLAEAGYAGPWPHGAVPLDLVVICKCGERAAFVAWPPSAAQAAAERAGWREGWCPAHA